MRSVPLSSVGPDSTFATVDVVAAVVVVVVALVDQSGRIWGRNGVWGCTGVCAEAGVDGRRGGGRATTSSRHCKVLVVVVVVWRKDASSSVSTANGLPLLVSDILPDPGLTLDRQAVPSHHSTVACSPRKVNIRILLDVLLLETSAPSVTEPHTVILFPEK